MKILVGDFLFGKMTRFFLKRSDFIIISGISILFVIFFWLPRSLVANCSCSQWKQMFEESIFEAGLSLLRKRVSPKGVKRCVEQAYGRRMAGVWQAYSRRIAGRSHCAGWMIRRCWYREKSGTSYGALSCASPLKNTYAQQTHAKDRWEIKLFYCKLKGR